jgi:serine/threonine protein kinase
MLAPNTFLQSRYRIIQVIGSGGMSSAVYLAEDAHMSGYRCAIKEMSPDQIPSQDRSWAIGAFQQEAQMLATLNHPGVVRVSDHFAEFGNWYLVMEYITGQTLEEYLVSAPRGVPLSTALDFIDQLCAVLDYLHSRTPPVIFRDLKPGNVMLTPDGEVKLIDFGIARFFKVGQTRNTVNLGTPGYASPEHSSGQTDRRSDVYSLGVLLLQLVTGYDPATAAVPFVLPQARALNPAVPAQIEAVIQRATQLRPEQRFQSVTEFRQALAGLQVLPPPSTEPQATGTSKWFYAIAGAVAIVLIAAGALAAVNQTPIPTPPVARSPSAVAPPTEGNPNQSQIAQALASATLDAPTPAPVVTLSPTPPVDLRAVAQQAVERFQELRIQAQHSGDTSPYPSMLRGDALSSSIQAVETYKKQGCHMGITDRAPMFFAFEEVTDARVVVTAQRSETRALICPKSTKYYCENYEGYYIVERLPDGWFITAKGVRNNQPVKPCP